jgi:hypothetical protein
LATVAAAPRAIEKTASLERTLIAPLLLYRASPHKQPSETELTRRLYQSRGGTFCIQRRICIRRWIKLDVEMQTLSGVPATLMAKLVRL